MPSILLTPILTPVYPLLDISMEILSPLQFVKAFSKGKYVVSESDTSERLICQPAAFLLFWEKARFPVQYLSCFEKKPYRENRHAFHGIRNLEIPDRKLLRAFWNRKVYNRSIIIQSGQGIPIKESIFCILIFSLILTLCCLS